MKFKVGDLVQSTGKKIRDGEVIAVIPAKKQIASIWSIPPSKRKPYSDFAMVKWEDGSESKEDMLYLFNRDTALEREFRLLQNKVFPLIEEKLKIASKALQEAINISEKYGLPFCANISFVNNRYTPQSFNSKLDEEFISCITGVFDTTDGPGWSASAIC